MRVAYELLIIDQVPLFGEARGEFERAYQSIARLKLDLHQHETYDLPAYTAWLNRTFGKYQSYVRDISAIIAEKQTVLAEVREQHWNRFFGGSHGVHFESGLGPEEDEGPRKSFCGMHARWQAFAEDPAEGAGGPDEYGPRHEENRYQESGRYYDDEDEAYFEWDDDSKRRFEDLFSRRAAGTEGGFSSRTRATRGRDESRRERVNRGSGRESNPESVAEPLTQQELANLKIKETYRMLARKLHPDANPDLTSEEKRLWNQVQAAYEERDLQQLELLLALASVFSGKIARDTSLHQMRRATDEVKRLVAPLQRKLEAARKSRAWKFSDLEDRGDLTRAVEKDFQCELAQLRQKLAEIDSQIQRFSVQQDEEL